MARAEPPLGDPAHALASASAVVCLMKVTVGQRYGGFSLLWDTGVICKGEPGIC